MTDSSFSMRCCATFSRVCLVCLGVAACSDGAANAGHGANGEVTDDDIRRPRDAGAPDARPTDGGSTPATWWQPRSDKPIHWHWQLSDTFVYPRDMLANVTVYDIDGELTPASTVASLHAANPNNKAICYFDAGVWEDFRSDAKDFPKSVIGNPDEGWDGHYWLDIRQMDILLPIMKKRMINWCKNKGFDAVEPDETEVWSNNPGFPITKRDNAAYHKALADMAHSLGLSIGLKGNNTEAVELEPLYDWALTEECWEFDECRFFKDSFAAKGKAVFNVEYKKAPNCTSANSWRINSSQRDLQVTGPKNAKYVYRPCVPDSRNTW
ncbi:endo alpha-1,4 polygalactosaminidase [Pendulispora brunnea]|uniref:Endo alpha-1,4 polygalactosaminidase n=1 Tax=Pendulispora brunnea TaxID=2905690 RepID=A0ABZ2KL00_9BACT